MAGVENPTAPVLWSTGAMTFFSTVAGMLLGARRNEVFSFFNQQKMCPAADKIPLPLAVAAYGELHATTLGLLLMTVSVVAEAFRMLVTQKLFTGKVRFSVVESLYYIGPIK